MQWIWDHSGRHLMLNTDMCLAYAIGSDTGVLDDKCCCNCNTPPAVGGLCASASGAEHDAHLAITRPLAEKYATNEVPISLFTV